MIEVMNDIIKRYILITYISNMIFGWLIDNERIVETIIM